MKLKSFLALLVAIGLTHSISFAQKAENQNPYAIFGGKPYVAGAEQNKEQVKVFVIENIAEGSYVERLEHNTETGVVTYFDKAGEILGHKQLKQGERAWPSIDKKAEMYYSNSPYAFSGNNPIRYVDPNGMEFTEAAWAWVNRLIDDVNSQQGRNNNRIAAKEAQLAAGGLSDKKAERLNRQIGNLQSSNANLEAVRGEVAVLAGSSQIYDVMTDNSRNTSDMMVGGFGFNFSNGNAEIMMPSGGGMGLFAHELKHAYQFETGSLSIGPRMPNDPNGYTNFVYDKHDEVAAYSRGAMFGQTAYGINNLPSAYNNLPTGPIDVVTHPGLAAINALPAAQRAAAYQGIANSTRHAFRVGGQTYYRPR